MANGNGGTRGDLDATLGLNLQAFRSGLREASNAVKQFASTFTGGMTQASNATNQVNGNVRQVRQNMKDLERIVGGIVLAQGFYALKSAIEEAAVSLVSFMNEMERAQIALEYFLATPQQATAFLNSMNDFAATTSFNTTQALTLSRKLMAAQFDPNDVRGIMEILNDASAATGGTPQQMDRIVLALTQIRTNGKLAGQEMRQLAEAGIPIYRILQEELGLTGAELMKVGKLGVSGEAAVNAVLNGLQKRYEGAAERLALTVPGLWQTIVDDSKILGTSLFQAPYNALQKFLHVWRDTWEEARDHLTKGGLGRVLEEMFPPEVHTAIRLIAGSIKSLGASFVTLVQAMKPVIATFAGGLLNALGIIMPIIAGVARAVAWMTQAAIQAFPPLKYLAAAIIGLLVAQGAAKVMLFFWSVLRLGTIASVVGKAVVSLAKAIRLLTLAAMRSPVGIVLALAGALLYVSGAAKVAFGWLENLMQKMAQLGGFDFESQLKNVGDSIAEITDFDASGMDTVGSAAEDMADGVGDSVDKAKGKAEDFKKFLASFDEVYQMPEDDAGSGSGGDDGAGGAGGAGGGAPDFSVDVPTFDEDDFFPDEIELPKLTWPEIEWPPFLARLLKPFNIDIKFNMPPPPDFGVVVEAWQFTVDWMKKKVGELKPVVEGIASWVPDLSLNWTWDVPNPIPVLKPVLDGVVKNVDGWATTLAQTVSLMGSDMWKNLQTSLGNIQEGFSVAGEWIVETWATVVTSSFEALSNIGQEISKAVDQWAEDIQIFGLAIVTAFLIAFSQIINGITTWKTNMTKTFSSMLSTITQNVTAFSTGLKTTFTSMFTQVTSGISTFFKNAKATFSSALGQIKGLWENHKGLIITIVSTLLLAILTIFTGGLGGVATFIVGWLPKAGQLFTKLGPLVATAIKNLPGKFTSIWNTVSGAIPGILTKISGAFKALPKQIYNAIKSIPAQFKEIFGKINLPSFKTLSSGVSATFKSLASVAGFETGGIIGKDSIVRVGEKGKKEAIIPLQNETAMQPFVDAVTRGILASLPSQPGTSNQGGSGNDLPPVYVGTLIADERGLRELEQKLRVVRLNQGGANR